MTRSARLAPPRIVIDENLTSRQEQDSNDNNSRFLSGVNSLVNQNGLKIDIRYRLLRPAIPRQHDATGIGTTTKADGFLAHGTTRKATTNRRVYR